MGVFYARRPIDQRHLRVPSGGALPEKFQRKSAVLLLGESLKDDDLVGYFDSQSDDVCLYSVAEIEALREENLLLREENERLTRDLKGENDA